MRKIKYTTTDNRTFATFEDAEDYQQKLDETLKFSITEDLDYLEECRITSRDIEEIASYIIKNHVT